MFSLLFSFPLLALLSIVYSSSTNEEVSNLYFVFEHFRHGARSPTNGLNLDYVDIFGSKWNGNGELTKNGMIQQYIIGLRNKERYRSFIDTNYDPKEIVVYSTNVNRTIISAQIQLSGMYSDVDIKVDKNVDERVKPPINNTFDFDKKITAIPVPIHTYEDRVIKGENKVEKLMDFDRDVNCPKYKVFREKNKAGPIATKFIKDFEGVYGSFFRENFNVSADNFKAIHTICDVYIANYYDQRDLSKFGDSNKQEQFLNKCFEFERIKQYHVEQGGDAAFSGVLSQSETLRKVIYWMEQRMKFGDRLKSNYTAPKYVMYSAHDTTISSMQSYFIQAFKSNNLSYIYSPYASTQYLELIKEENDFYVVYYFNDELIFKKKFDEFKKEAESIMWTEDAVHDYCVGYSTSDVIIISLGCALIAFFAITISLICYFCRRERKRDFMKVIDSKEDQTQP